jgi:hypothetical protein
MDENRGVTDRNGGVADRNRGDKEEKIKVKKSTKKHNSKLDDTMNTAQENSTTAREYEEVVFQGDEIPEQDETFTLIQGLGKKTRKPRKTKVDKVEDIAVANEITIEVAVPLTLEESDRFARVDAEAEVDEVVSIMTEEDCLLAEAEIMMQKAEELKKEAQRRIADKKLRENIAEVREKAILPKRNRLGWIKDEIQRLQEQVAVLEIEIEDIEEGQKDDELIEIAIVMNRVAEKRKVVKGKKVKAEVKAEGAKAHTIKRRLPLDEVLEEGDAVFVKSHPHLTAIWDNGVFKVMSDDVDENADEGEFYSFKNLNQVNLFHHKEILGKANEPNAWKAYALRRADGEVVELDDVFLA